MVDPVKADIPGLDAFRKDLRRAGPAGRKAMGRANKEAATLVADQAVSNAKAKGGSAAKGAGSIKASGAAAAAAITLGGAKAPWEIGAEFGAKQFAQFPKWKGNQWNPDGGTVGYFLHPAVRDTREEFLELYGDRLMKAAEVAFPN